MLSRLVSVLLRWSTGRATLIAFGVLIAGGFLLFQLAPYELIRDLVGGTPLPEEGTTYEGGLVSFLQELGDVGRRMYLRFQYWDLLNPVLQVSAFTLLIGWLVKRARLEQHWLRFAVLIPGFAAGADLGENLLLIDAIHSFPGPGAGSVLVAPVTAVKFLGVAVLMVATALLGVAAIIRRRVAA